MRSQRFVADDVGTSAACAPGRRALRTCAFCTRTEPSSSMMNSTAELPEVSPRKSRMFFGTVTCPLIVKRWLICPHRTGSASRIKSTLFSHTKKAIQSISIRRPFYPFGCLIKATSAVSERSVSTLPGRSRLAQTFGFCFEMYRSSYRSGQLRTIRHIAYVNMALKSTTLWQLMTRQNGRLFV